MQPDQTMNPAETLAALKLLEVALKGAIAAAEPAAEDYRKATRAKQLETDYGLLYVTRYKPSIVVDDVALMLWAEEHAPELITTTRGRGRTITFSMPAPESRPMDRSPSLSPSLSSRVPTRR